MKSWLALTCFIFISLVSLSQSSTIDLTFTAVNNTAHIQMDSIKVMNRTQGGDTVLYWPDTVLSLYFTDIPEPKQQASGFKVFQNYPNPVNDLTTISIYVPELDKVTITVMDLLGRVILNSERRLDKGIHSFRFSPGNGNLYFFAGQWKGNTSSIKIIQAPTGSNSLLSLEYQGSINSNPQLKLMEEIQEFNYALGDLLLYIAYTDTLESGLLDNPEESQTYTFQFATNIPCPGTPVITYEGKTYNTIQIFSQCWLKENLDVGMIIPGTMEQSDNVIIEKYCYNDEPDSCSKYGGFYQWDEMMQYTTQLQAKGICPNGWHIPDDEEWKVLEGAVDSVFGIGHSTWDGGWSRGFDAGGNLKSVEGWIGENGTDRYGFTGFPAGYRNYTGSYSSVGYYGEWWTSKIETSVWAWHRYLNYLNSSIQRTYHDDVAGFSVRCLRDN